MQVTLGDEGSGLSAAAPLFLPMLVKKGEARPPLKLPLERRRRRKKEKEKEAVPPPRSVVVSFMEEI